MEAKDIIKILGLKPLPGEGGFFRETYRSDEKIVSNALPSRYGIDKSFSTAIYYLITPESFSTMHRIRSDEIFHFYLGDPVLMLILEDTKKPSKLILGKNIDEGEIVQQIVPAYAWQGAMLADGGKFALMGTTVAPGYDFSDFEIGKRAELIERYPSEVKLITKLTTS